MVAAAAAATNKSSLNPEQQAAYVETRARLFKGTIVVACIYAAIAILIILFAIFSDLGAKVLTAVYPFTLTLVIGMIIVILSLVLQVTSWVPDVPPTLIGKDKCPDYWHIEQVPDEIVSAMGVEQQPFGRIRCVPDTPIYGTVSTADKIDATTNVMDSTKTKGTDKKNDLYRARDGINTKGTFATEAAKTGNDKYKFSCNNIYPNYMAQFDSENWPAQPNAVRCEWAKNCGVAWSGVCPLKSTTA